MSGVEIVAAVGCYFVVALFVGTAANMVIFPECDHADAWPPHGWALWVLWPAAIAVAALTLLLVIRHGWLNRMFGSGVHPC